MWACFYRALESRLDEGPLETWSGLPSTPLFLLETGVSSLCPVPCSEIFYQKSGIWGGNWRQSGQRAASRRTESRCQAFPVTPPPRPPVRHLNPGALLRPRCSASCRLIKLLCCLQFVPSAGSGRLFLLLTGETTEQAPPAPPLQRLLLENPCLAASLNSGSPLEKTDSAQFS